MTLDVHLHLTSVVSRLQPLGAITGQGTQGPRMEDLNLLRLLAPDLSTHPEVTPVHTTPTGKQLELLRSTLKHLSVSNALEPLPLLLVGYRRLRAAQG